MSSYRLLYGIGFTPWEHLARLPQVTEQISTLFDREEEGRQLPFGQALDLGCGSGFWSVELAKRGWQVTGVDFVPKAVRRARKRARQAAVEVRLLEADVTRLSDTEVGAGFPFLIDFGLFHDELTDGQRVAMGREVSAAAAPGAALLMMAWAPRRGAPLWRGASLDDIEAAYPDWTVTDEHPFDVSGARFYRHIKNPGARVYRLKHE